MSIMIEELVVPKVVFNGKMNQVNMEKGLICYSGIVEIDGFLLRNYRIHLPDWWSYECNINSGKYSGSFVKRVRKYLHEEYKIELSQEHCSELGSIVGNYCNNSNEYNFFFTKRLWNNGDFKDGNSCYWGDKCYAPDMIFGEGGGGVCFYEGEKGVGRCWILPFGDDWVIFNARGLGLQEIAIVLSKYLGLEYRFVQVSNNGSTEQHLYLDGDGYVLSKDISKYNDMDDPSQIDFEIDENEYVVYCQRCEQIAGNPSEINRYTYCGSCAEEFRECDICNEQTLFYEDIDDKIICKDCQQDVHECEKCRTEKHEDNMKELDGVGWVCEDCEDDYSQCPHCDKYHVKD